jgi:predicted deacylase
MSLQIGNATAVPGQIVYGVFEALPLPTGGTEFFPVIVAQGRREAQPVLWLTANIHGSEYDGIAVIHRLITESLVRELRGTIVAIPTLSPAGLRTGARSPYYLNGRDPNRLFPGLPAVYDDQTNHFAPALEQAYARLFDSIQSTASYLIDLHDFGIRSIPFAFRDPVFFHSQADKPVAMKLQQTIGGMLDALGLTVINEFASNRYMDMDLHRSVSGATLNRARIPAITIEIGGQQTVHELHVQAVVVGIRNVMRWAGMLPGSPEPLPPVPVIRPGYPVRRTIHPRVPYACIVHHLVQPGDFLKAGDPVARMVDIYGRPVGPDDGLLRTRFEGFVIGLFPGIAFYPNDAIMGLAVRDHNELVVPAPPL